MEKTASTPIQLFRGMTADELAALRAAHCIRVQRYDKNALIYHAGRVVHEIGIVQSGSVNVESNDLWGNKSILSHVEAGQAFAETYALCGEPLMVDVAAAGSRAKFYGWILYPCYSSKTLPPAGTPSFCTTCYCFLCRKTWRSPNASGAPHQKVRVGGC